jgi:hypothetical protein
MLTLNFEFLALLTTTQKVLTIGQNLDKVGIRNAHNLSRISKILSHNFQTAKTTAKAASRAQGTTSKITRKLCLS